MQLTFTDIKPIRARRTDPATSQRAAQQSASFADSHAGRIVRALKANGQCSTHALSELTGLTVVQIDRRKSELQRMGLVRVVDDKGRYSVLEAVA